MGPKKLFEIVLTEVDGCVDRIQASQLRSKTPCADWSLKQLLNHMVYELLWMPDILAGKTVKEVGDKYDGDVLGDDFHTAWRDASAKALVAVEAANLDSVAHLSYADVPAGDYITEMTGEMTVHGWDVGQSTKCTMRYDDSIYQILFDYFEPRMEGFRANGLVGPTVTADSSNKRAVLLGLFGRKDPS